MAQKTSPPAHSPTPQRGPAFFKKRDVFILLGIVALALVLFLLRGQRPGGVATVTVGLGEAQSTHTLQLAEDRLVDFDAALPAHLEVKDGAVRFIQSECPDHLCEHVGWLRNEGEEAICLPAGVAVRVTEGGENLHS